MANPTTYFGWVMPTSSSLVTNLPADFNTFGQGVDTSLQDLLGGTTGQVLSKTSATNMDFTWVTPTDQTPLTTKGDLFTFTTVDARLGVGTNGQILSANSATATGLEWITNDVGDITAVTAGTGISGGGTSGSVTVTNSMATAMTTKGDLVQATGSGAFARLGVVAHDTVLTADSTAATGMKWAAASGGGGPTFKATRSGGNQSFSTSTTTKIQYNTEIWDSDSCYDPTTNYRFTPNKAGYYEVTVSAYLTQGSTSDVYLYIRKNGADNSLFYAGATATASSVQVNAIVDMNGSTDYLEGFIYADGSSPSVVGTGSYTYFNSIFIRSL